MSKISYTKNYFQIYFWQGISLILNFLSMFIVVPFLTSEPNVYGIYTVCISVSIFLSYADFGFMGAGQKYAAEYFSRGQTKEEIKVIGFTLFVLMVFLLFLSAVFLLLSSKPSLLINGINDGNQIHIASTLLLIIALFTPVSFLQRLTQMIYGIRLEDYIVQRINICANTIKIASVFWFFRNNEYNIIGYFLFTQILSFASALVSLYIAKKRYNYDFKTLIKSIRFSSEVFSKTKGLAFTSLYLTVIWILYYELDSTVIGKFFGANHVAFYAIGLTILSFFRSIFGIFYAPFNARFNHFVGQNDSKGLKDIYSNVVIFFAPVVVIPILTMTLLASPIILTWVGDRYVESVEIAQFLIMCNLFAFITYPTGILMMAKEKLKDMYIVNTLIPIVFWTGIILTNNFWGIKSFAIFKLVAFVFSAIVYYKYMLKYIGMKFSHSINVIFKPLILPVLFVVSISLIIKDYLPVEKSKEHFLIVLFAAFCIMCISFCIQIFTSNKIRHYFILLLKRTF